jgi:hypothetical protein
MDIFAIILIWVVFSAIVANFGKKRTIGFGTAFVVSLLLSPLVGLLFVLFSDERKDSKEAFKYLEHRELGKKAEYKGQFAEAIDHYMDSLYHLENDHKHLSRKSEEKRLKQVQEIKERVDTLKLKLSTPS